MRKELRGLIEYIRHTYKDSNVVYVNLVLYCMDYLSIELDGYPITWDTYFNVNGQPYSSAVLVLNGQRYEYVELVNESAVKAGVLSLVDTVVSEFNLLRSLLGDDGVDLFVKGTCDIQGKPRIDSKYMLGYSLRGKDKMAKVAAYDKFERAHLAHMAQYTRLVKLDDGELILIPSTKYAAD